MLELSNKKLKILHVADAKIPSLGGGTAERSFQLALALQRIVSESTAEHLVTDYVRQKRSAEKIQRELQGLTDIGVLRPTAFFGNRGKNLLKLAGTVAEPTFFFAEIAPFHPWSTLWQPSFFWFSSKGS